MSELTDKALEGESGDISEQMQTVIREKSNVDARLREHRQRIAVMDRDESRLREMFEILEGYKKHNASYDDQLVAAVIDQVSVNTDGTLTIRMINGFEISVDN